MPIEINDLHKSSYYFVNVSGWLENNTLQGVKTFQAPELTLTPCIRFISSLSLLNTLDWYSLRRL